MAEPSYRHVVNWSRIADSLELACEIRDVSLRDVAEACGLPASGLTRLRQGKHLSADGLAALEEMIEGWGRTMEQTTEGIRALTARLRSQSGPQSEEA